MKRGFTLVELSIVLVIIGLLIGGILVAQSMIETAKIQSFVKYLGQFDAAVNNFKTNYNALPGDSSALGCTVATSNTCDNGIIEDSAGDVHPFYFNAEIANFWPQLQSSGFVIPGSNLTATITTSFSIQKPNQNSPVMPLGINTGIIPYDNNDTSPLGTGEYGGHFYFVSDFTNVANTTQYIDGNKTGVMSGGHFYRSAPSISAMSALAVDTKIDDGYALKKDGSNNFLQQDVISYQGNNGGNCAVNTISTNVPYSSASDSVCSLLIRMNVQ